MEFGYWLIVGLCLYPWVFAAGLCCTDTGVRVFDTAPIRSRYVEDGNQKRGRRRKKEENPPAIAVAISDSSGSEGFLSSSRQMEGRFAEELYSESLQLSKLQLDPTSNANSEQSNLHDLDRVELCHEDGSCDGFSDELDDTSEVTGEWMKIEEKTRYNQHHTVGYREGVIAGKEASSQEGFNIGFKQSVLVGYNWGLVRGVTSALANLPDGLREKLIGTEDQITGLQGLYESVHSLSTTDALRLFNDEIMDKKAREQRENADTSSLEAGLAEQIPDRRGLRNHFAELRSLLLESPAIKVHLDR